MYGSRNIYPHTASVIVQISQFMLQSCLPYIDKGIYGQDRAVFVFCCVAFRSAYARYTSFKRLAGHESSRCLTLRPPAGLLSAFSRKRNEVYWNVHPLTMTQKMPKSDRWRRVSPCQFRVNIVIINGSRNRRGFVKKPSPFFYKQKLTLSGV